MEDPGTSSGGGGGDDWWKEFEDKNKKKFESKDQYPDFENPAELFSLKNQNSVHIRPGKKQMPYGGQYLSRLRDLIDQYDIPFKGGDQYLENTNLSVDQLRKTPIGRLALARDELMAFLFNIYETDKGGWEALRVTGFLQWMIRVAQGETCNNELSKELRKCLGLKP
jgi:hypothetical protein